VTATAATTAVHALRLGAVGLGRRAAVVQRHEAAYVLVAAQVGLLLQASGHVEAAEEQGDKDEHCDNEEAKDYGQQNVDSKTRVCRRRCAFLCF